MEVSEQEETLFERDSAGVASYQRDFSDANQDREVLGCEGVAAQYKAWEAGFSLGEANGTQATDL